ncbi:HTH-type transcriptional activator CmpR [compost metagenome]
MARTLDLGILRGFVSAIDHGSLVKAADTLGRSTSAMSAQIQRLEYSIGTPVFRKDGRRLVATEAGLVMASYARRLLALNDEALVATYQMQREGHCRLGIQQDFCDLLLSQALGQFSRSHPNVQIELLVSSNSELAARIANKTLDLVIGWDTGQIEAERHWSIDLPMCWIGSARSHADLEHPLPLIALGEECYFRTASIKALDQANISWRIAMTSASLSGIWAGVHAGIGLTARTMLGLPKECCRVDSLAEPNTLPPLPKIAVSAFMTAYESHSTAAFLSGLFREAIGSAATR